MSSLHENKSGEFAKKEEEEEEEEEEKYAKARRQSRGGLLVVVTILTIGIVLGSYLRHGGKRKHRPSSSQLMMMVRGGVANANNMIQEAEENHLLPPPKKAPTLQELRERVQKLDNTVREVKTQVDIFETDEKAQRVALLLQDATRELLHALYGPAEPYRIRVDLEFQPTIPDFAENGPEGYFVMELAPSRLVPHSVYTFMEIARQWKGGAFHRIAHHVLQVMVRTHSIRHLAFQEYSPEYPHKERTVGYAGRPSGPAWYVSIQDNTHNHGPGSQQKHNPYEADAAIGRVIEGYEESVLRITKVQGQGFLGDAKKHVLIKAMTILVPAGSDSDNYIPWSDPEKHDTLAIQ